METIKTLQRKVQQQEPIAMLTAYDASMAALQQQAGVDAILVGDSLGMVVQGHRDTIAVTLDMMVYHTANVRRGAATAFVIADIPFMAAANLARGLRASAALMQQGGADAVKLEGGDRQTLKVIAALVRAAVPVCGHLGLQPQQVRYQGGYAVAGKKDEEAKRITAEATALHEAGARMLVLECVPEDLAAHISADWMQREGVVIGIGSGADCHGQVLVSYDVLGISARMPSFSRNFMAGTGSVKAAFSAYVEAVKSRQFP